MEKKKLGISKKATHKVKSMAGCGKHWLNLCGARQG